MLSLEVLLSSAKFCMLLFVETFLSLADTSAKCLVGANGLYELFRCIIYYLKIFNIHNQSAVVVSGWMVSKNTIKYNIIALYTKFVQR